ncbi:glycerol-3-phosphate acyltransferase [Anaerocellum diazotrophicum]|nr:glycerol-3-phosphate acyltransferase [Caldicellulosiruptor diazotrophicus]
MITKKFFNKDITHFYDNNPGATNAFRVAGIKNTIKKASYPFLRK